MARKLSSFTDGFYQFTEGLGSPSLFRKWAGIFTVAAALERKAYCVTNRGVLHPNLYIVLVGPPGAGKTMVTDKANELIHKLEDHHIAPTSLTKASMMDSLREAERKIIRPTENPPIITFNSLAIIANELGVLIPAYENDFMNVLTDLYDGKIYAERRRTKELNFRIEAPQLNIIAATTPSYLNNLMPEGAWDQGFLSRTFLVYSSRGEITDPFSDKPVNGALHSHLVHDIKEIGKLMGKFRFEEAAIDAFRAWLKTKEEPVPEHPKLISYNSRRQSHLLKLCMVSSAASSDSLIVTLDNYAEAFDWLLEMEAAIPDIFKAMATVGSSRVMDEVWFFAYQRWMKDKKPVPEPLLLEFISQRTPTHEVARLLEVMVRSKIFTSIHIAGLGVCYEPRARR